MKIATKTKRMVAARAGGYCEYCKSHEDFSTASFAVEHIIPRFKMGSDESDNLAYSCLGCNAYKHTRTSFPDPETGLEAPLFNPRTQDWAEHFCWDDSCLLLMGLTPTGRATVELLRLNRPALLNLRRALVRAGEHPPK
ncbi:MAG: HNH endonuclease [Phycisphaerae bacterium]|nr:HNH endonuclease [Saprospiraceae bacterium]